MDQDLDGDSGIEKEFSMNEFVKELIGEEDACSFAQWAIGDDYENIMASNWPEKWNELHGDLFSISPDGFPAYDLPSMISYWRIAVVPSPDVTTR